MVKERVDEAYARYEKLGHLEIEDMFIWLDSERIIGAYNMFEAPKYLLEKFSLELRDIKEARLVTNAWMETFK